MKFSKMAPATALLGLCSLLAGCTDAEKAQYSALGDKADVTCYSGGKVFYHGTSTGKVATEDHSDGWYFREAETNDLVRVSGPCVVRNATPQSIGPRGAPAAPASSQPIPAP